MAYNTDRMVRRIQRRQQSAGSNGRASSAGSHEIAELESRLQRLRAIDERFNHARLSSDVTSGGVAEARFRVRGEFVATEV